MPQYITSDVTKERDTATMANTSVKNGFKSWMVVPPWPRCNLSGKNGNMKPSKPTKDVNGNLFAPFFG